MLIKSRLIDEIILRAFREDIGTGDVTTLSTVPSQAVTRGYILAKEDGIVAGLAVAERVFQLLSGEIEFRALKSDGDRISTGEILAEVSGSAVAILTGERVALNLLQRMSGIATKTFKLMEKISAYETVVIDTRKTMPGIRMLDKYAVKVGGGRNHRFGLYDGILIKDNHIRVAGGIKRAVELARTGAPHMLQIEVEVETMAAVKEALEAGADIIMLDNMSPSEVREAVEIIKGQAKVEASGGINENNIIEYASAGVDFCSVGGLTHSVKALDISLDLGE